MLALVFVALLLPCSYCQNVHNPRFIAQPSTFRISELTPVGADVFTCNATDDDTGPAAALRYSIVAGNEEKFFALDPDTCNLSLQRALDYETNNSSFNLTIAVHDLDPVSPRSAEQTFQFCVTDVNDNKPTWVTTLTKKMEIIENPPLGMHVGRCSATDGDTSLHPSGTVRYAIKGGNRYSLFYLNPYTCDLYVNGLLDYEDDKSHTLKIIAFDLDPVNPLESDVMKTKVKTVDENDNGPMCQANMLTTEVSEVTAAKSVLMTLNCSDVDGGRANSALRFKALSKSQDLQVEKMTGNIKLSRKQDWDDVSRPRELTLVVQVTDNSSKKPITASATVRVIVTDADDIKPVFQKANYTTVVKEDLPRGSTLVQVSATDQDKADSLASTVQYGLLTQPTPEYFLLNPYTGQLVLKKALDAELFVSSDVKVFAFSSGRPDKQTKADIFVHIEDVNDTGPKFTREIYHINVDEARNYTAPLLTVQALDPDTGVDGKVQYSIGDGPLQIDTIAGQIKLNRIMNFEEQYYYTIPVRAYDQGTPSLTATATVVLTIRPVNEYDPVWIIGTDITVSEDTLPGTVLFQLNATDEDQSWDGVVEYWSPQSPSPDLPFVVDQTGQVLLAAPLDYDTLNTYAITVIARDRSNDPLARRSVTTTLGVAVTDVNDLAPVCPPLTVAADVYPWTGSPIASLKCSPDADTVNGKLSYSIVSGDPGGVFQIDSAGGTLSAKSRPTQDMYELTVEVDDGGTPPMVSSMAVVVLVEPSLQLTNLPASIKVKEDATVGTSLYNVTACCSFTTVQYELVFGNDANLFHLHSSSGAITLLGGLDREVTSQHELTLEVKDERGQTATGILLINIEDINDNAPVFNPVFSSLWLVEEQPVGTLLGQWTAEDADQNANTDLTYSLVDSMGGTFSVDSKTGVLSLTRGLDYETDRAFTLLLVANDQGSPPLSVTATIQVEVVNTDEHIPQFVRKSGSNVTVREDTAVGQVVFVLQAHDEDVSDVTRYSLRQTAQQVPFSVGPDSGEVVLNSPLDREAVAEYHLQFEAVSKLGSTAAISVTVLVQDADDNDPMFSKTVYEFHVPHDTATDVTVGHVSVTDDDIGANADFIVTIVSGNGAGYFDTDGMDVKTARPVRYDEVKGFTLTLRAHHTGKAAIYRYSQAVVKIYVLPAITVPEFEVQTLTLEVQENAPVNTLLCDLDATMLGAIEGENGTVQYIIRSGNEAGAFALKEDTGKLRVAGPIDYETQSTYTLVIDADSRNQPGKMDSIIVNVSVINLNDNAPRPDSAVYNFTVNDNATVGTTVGRVLFRDNDRDPFGSFSLTMSGCLHFDVESDTGDVIVKTAIDHHIADTHLCFVTATDKGQPPRSAMTSVFIDIHDVNDHPPMFVGTPYNGTVYEDTPVGSILTTVMAKDNDEGVNGQVTYSVLAGDPGGVFSVNSTEGQVVLKAPLNAKATPRFVLKLQAADGGSPALTSVTTVTLNVVDVNNNAPVFVVKSTSLDVAVERVAPPGTELAVLKASDGDVDDNARVTFTITEGNREGLFFINRNSGRLVTQGWLTEARNTYTLTVTAMDNGIPAQATFINLTTFITPPLADNTTTGFSVQTLTVAEDAAVGSAVGTIYPYPASRASAYSIVSGNYQNSFDVVTQSDGTGQLRVAKTLDYETYNVYQMLINVETANATIQKVVQVNVTDVNDNAPRLTDGPSLVLTVAEHYPAGHTLWTLQVHDADSNDTNSTMQYQVDSVDAPGLLNVTADGEIQLNTSPDYEIYQQVKAVITVRDNGTPQMSSSLTLTLHITDVEERQTVPVTAAATVYISTEIPYNTREGQTVYLLSASDFNLTESSISTTTYTSLDASGPFAINAGTGEVTVSAPNQLADNSVYFQWVVCTVSENNGSAKFEIAMLRIDTYDKYRNVVAVQLSSDVADVEAQRSVLLGKLQAMFSSIYRVGIFTVIAHGATARRRLLSTDSLALIYVVEDKSADQLDNIQADKTFLTWEQLLKTLQLSSNGTPVAALTSGSLPVELVLPYQSGQSDSQTFTTSSYFTAIVAVLAILLFLIIVFIITCIVYKAKKRKGTWNVKKAETFSRGTYKNKFFNTPAPAFFIRRDTLFPDDVSFGSSTSLLDDDSGIGGSVGSRSQARKSSTPSTISGASDSISGDEEVTLSPKNLLNNDVYSRWQRESVPDASNKGTPARAVRKNRSTRNKSKPKAADANPYGAFPNPIPPLSWLPPLPQEKPSGRRGSNLSLFDSPSGPIRYGRRASGYNTNSYTPSDSSSGRRVSQQWKGFEGHGYDFGRRESQDMLSSLRRSSILTTGRLSLGSIELNPLIDSPYAKPQTGHLTSPPKPYVPKPDPDSTSSAAEAKQETQERESTKRTTPGPQVQWKPKRNTVKIFHEKLRWNAVSTIPKATALPARRQNPIDTETMKDGDNMNSEPDRSEANSSVQDNQ